MTSPNNDFDQKLNTEASERRTFIGRHDSSLYLKSLHRNLQYIEQIGANQELSRGLKIKKRHEYVNKFITNMSLSQRNYSYLTSYHFGLIDDKSSYEQKPQSFALRTFQNLICLQKVHEFIQSFLKRLPLIQPDNPYKIIWDVIAILSRAYFLYFIPLDMAWLDQEFVFHLFRPTTLLMIFFMILDQIIEFNTAYFECGQIVNSRIKIVKNSLLRNYGTEWISTFIIIIYLVIQSTNSIKIDPTQNLIHLSLLLVLIQTSRIRQIIKHYEQTLNVKKKASSILQLIKFIIFLLYFLHLFACFWFWVGLYSSIQGEQSWVSTYGILNSNWNIQYLDSLYFTTVTMFTVGYGEVVPVSNLEKGTIILFIVITSIQLPYSINTVGKFIEQITAYGEETMRKLSIINSYMQKRKISSNLQLEIRQYLNYYWETQYQQDNEDQNKIINQLSECLREKLMTETYQTMLNDCPLFKNKFSSQLKSQLVKKIKSVIYPPESFIDSDQIYLCFIDDGNLEIILDINHQYPVGKLGKGQSLGIPSFITGKNAPEKFKCTSFVKVMLLSRIDFIKCLQDLPSDYEIFCQMKDYITFNPDKQLFPSNCFSCLSNFHKLIECPLIHYVPDKEFILKQHIMSQAQLRSKQYQRSLYRKKQWLTNLTDLTKAAWKIQYQRFEQLNLYTEGDDFKRIIKRQRSITFYNEKDIFGKYKQKFISIIKKVIYILRLKNKKNISLINLFPQSFTQQLQERMKILKKNPNLFEKQIDQIQSLLEITQIKNSLSNFEISHDYKFYNQDHNVSSIFPLYTKLKVGLINRFMPYVLYPSDIIKRFKCQPSRRNIVNYRRRKNVILI